MCVKVKVGEIKRGERECGALRVIENEGKGKIRGRRNEKRGRAKETGKKR